MDWMIWYDYNFLELIHNEAWLWDLGKESIDFLQHHITVDYEN